MNDFNFLMADAVATEFIALLAGFTIGLIMWIIRFLTEDLPQSGKI